jgi:hypothetical protein
LSRRAGRDSQEHRRDRARQWASQVPLAARVSWRSPRLIARSATDPAGAIHPTPGGARRPDRA